MRKEGGKEGGQCVGEKRKEEREEGEKWGGIYSWRKVRALNKISYLGNCEATKSFLFLASACACDHEAIKTNETNSLYFYSLAMLWLLPLRP